jgi:hypothetical protein
MVFPADWLTLRSRSSFCSVAVWWATLLAGVGCRKQVEPPPSTVVSLTTRAPRLEGASVVLEGQRETIHGQGEYHAPFEVPKTLPPGPPGSH